LVVSRYPIPSTDAPNRTIMENPYASLNHAINLHQSLQHTPHSAATAAAPTLRLPVSFHRNRGAPGFSTLSAMIAAPGANSWRRSRTLRSLFGRQMPGETGWSWPNSAIYGEFVQNDGKLGEFMWI
jgi:hypothetical protein